MKQYQKSYLLLIFCCFFFFSCTKSKEDAPLPVETGHIVFKFSHVVSGQALQKDTMMYMNAAGNPYEINQIKYFISDVTLHKADGTKKVISDLKSINYVDIDIPSTLTWNVFDDIPAGAYDSISFVFGISAEKNKSYLFVNPPESNMEWPDVLGGGYHYMMLNGKWKDTTNLIRNMNFHIGIGQLYKSNATNCVDSIYAFVQNCFVVNLPNSSFSLEKDKSKEIEIIMNIDSWFNSPHIFDFNYWGGNIMQNQPALQTIKENGRDVFSTGYIK